VAGELVRLYDKGQPGERERTRETGMRGRFLTLAAVATALTAGTSAFAAEPRAVVELFTSQGCSSCPPADKLLGELSYDQSLIPLTLAIDIWDYLGWKDTLALPGHARRQKAYSHVRGDHEGVYTPQAVINGTVQALGSDRAAIERAITQSHDNKATLSLPLTMTLDNARLTVTAPAGTNENATAEAWLCPISKSVEVAIGRGENSGHSFVYHNVVRRWVRIGVWNGKSATWSIPLADFKTDGVDAVAVIVQSGPASAPGQMLGAAFMSLDEAQTVKQ
jgi:hypothetical protein